KPPKENQWSIPGGAQELGETSRQAAIREVWEETAITIDEPVFLDVIDYIDRDKAGRILHHYTLIDYGANYQSGNLSAGDDAGHAKWVPIDRLSEYNLWGMTEKIIFQAVEKLKK
ncbi:MAG: NUDIX hydrolase, partial [Emcibacter sp.]|nr:NUDIX hydrolase [Emcibacter sp.]